MIGKIILVVLLCFTCGWEGYLLHNPPQIGTGIYYNYNMPTTTKDGLHINGFFDPVTGILTVYTQGLNNVQAEHTMLHEFGHYIYAQQHGELVVNDASELFAETYAVQHEVVQR